MTKVKTYKILIAIAETNYQVMDIMQYIANDTEITSEEFYDLFTDCKARIAEVLGTPKSIRA